MALPSSFVLADSPANIPCANFRVNGTRNIQEAQFFRATARSFYDRGNRQTEVTFETTRLFADQQTAEAFLLMHETMFPGQGLVTFTAGAPGGGTTSRYLVNAVVNSVESRMLGACATKHTYRITGGAMATSPT